MKRTIQCLALVFMSCLAMHSGRADDKPAERSPAPIVVTGQLRALNLLKVSSLDVP